MSTLCKRFTETVREYVKDVSQDGGVVGIVLTGSAGRTDLDKYSDIDNVVIVDGEHKIKDGKRFINDFLIDIRIVTLTELKDKWSDDMYFAYLKSAFVYDKDGKIKQLFDKKEKAWDEVIYRRLCLALVDIGFIYKFNDNWRHLKNITNYEKFMQRKDYVSTQRLLTEGFETILSSLYLLNRETLPDLKNRMKLLTGLKLLPENTLLDLCNGFLITSFTEQDLTRRYKVFESLVKKVVALVEQEFQLPENLDEYYFSERV